MITRIVGISMGPVTYRRVQLFGRLGGSVQQQCLGASLRLRADRENSCERFAASCGVLEYAPSPLTLPSRDRAVLMRECGSPLSRDGQAFDRHVLKPPKGRDLVQA